MTASVDKLYEEADRLYYDDKLDKAAVLYQKILDIDPDHQAALHSLGIIHYDRDEYVPAVDFMLKALEQDPEDIYVHSNLGKSLYGMVHMGERKTAKRIARQWAADYPDNRIALHMAAAVTGDGLPDRANDDYVAQTFDEFADTFDSKLEELNYRAPELLGTALARHVDGKGLRILDAGCGTGLCAPHLRPLARKLEGIDLSEEMLALAKKRKLYDRLNKAELTEALQTRSKRYDVAVAADVLCYFGDLTAVFGAMATAVQQGGLFAFTLETHRKAKDYDLGISGRYTHSAKYVRDSLAEAGFSIVEVGEEQLRTEYALPVKGLVVVARKEA